MVKRDTSQKSQSILDAALRAFREDGYDHASMDRIAELAGASKRTVYNHFESKDALFKAVVERYMGEIAALKDIPYDPDSSLEEQLGRFADAKLGVLSNPAWLGLFRVGLGVMIRDPELARGAMNQVESGEQHLTRWLRQAAADGRLTVGNPELASEVFWATISGAFIWPHLLFGPSEPDRIQVAKAEIVEIFLARYRNPES